MIRRLLLIIASIVFVTSILINGNNTYAHVEYYYIYNTSYICEPYEVTDDDDGDGWSYYYHYEATRCYYYSDSFMYRQCDWDYYYQFDFDSADYTSYGHGYGDRCYWYVQIEILQEKELLYNDEGYPLSNNDFTLYKGDSYKYHSIVIMKHIDPYNPSSFTNAYLGYYYWVCYRSCWQVYDDGIPDNTELVNPDDYFYDLPLQGIVQTNDNIDYGSYEVKGTIEYEVPYYHNYYDYYCWSSASGGGCRSESGIDDEPRSYNNVVTITSFEVVPYNPKFLVYPYLNIASTEEWSFDKPLMLMIHYLGSYDNSDNSIYPLRRSLVNSYSYNNYAYKVLEGYDIPTVDPEDIQQNLTNELIMKWNMQSNSCVSNMYVNEDVDNDGYDDKVMFMQEGYYLMRFGYPDTKPSGIMLNIEDYQLTDLTVNSNFYTTFNELSNTKVFDFTYIYPNRSFNNLIIIASIEGLEDDNLTLKPIPYISAIVNPIMPTDVYTWNYSLKDYLYIRYNYDIQKLYNTADNGMVDAIMCSEDADNNYNNSMIEVYNSAVLHYNYKLSSLWIGRSALDVYEVDTVWDIPLHYVLTAPTPYELTITVREPRDQVDEVTNKYILPAYQQYSTYHYFINAQDYDFTNRYIFRYGNLIDVINNRYFGIIDKVTVFDDNGFRLIECNYGCSFTVNGNTQVTAVNEWLGVGSAYFVAVDNPTNNITDANALVLLLIGIVIALGTIVILRKFVYEITD